MMPRLPAHRVTTAHMGAAYPFQAERGCRSLAAMNVWQQAGLLVLGALISGLIGTGWGSSSAGGSGTRPAVWVNGARHVGAATTWISDPAEVANTLDWEPSRKARLAADRAYIDALRRGVEPVDARLGPDTEWLSGPHRSNLEQARRR